MPTLLQVCNWEQFFEGAKSKTYNNKTTCSMPTKHGLGYRRLVRKKNGPAMFGAWCALIQVLSRHPKPREGYLTDTGGISGSPYTDTDLEMLTDIPANVFSELFEVTLSEQVGWLRIPDGYQTDTAVSPQYPLNSDLDLDSDSDLNSNSKPRAACLGEMANEIYQLYPRKEGKSKAIDSIKKALKKVDYQELFEAVTAYSVAMDGYPDKTKIPHPATWFNQERWEDDRTMWSAWRNADKPKHAPSPAMQQILDKIPKGDDISQGYTPTEPPEEGLPF